MIFKQLLQCVTGRGPVHLVAASLALWGCTLVGGGCAAKSMAPLPAGSAECIYYLDGAGGGGPVRSWCRGMQQGMRDAGYAGAQRVFNWHTGWGITADQTASVEFKRARGAELAAALRRASRQERNGRLTLIGQSAGTAVLVYALEELDEDCAVENAVLFASSVASDHDLTRALSRVRNKMYVFISERDAVLNMLVPVFGTADGRAGTVAPAGLRGFRMPASATPATRRQYAKLIHIPWSERFKHVGHFGGHTDADNRRFVQAYVAPLVMADVPQGAAADALFAVQQTRNPDYERWSRCGIGSWVRFDATESFAGRARRMQVKMKLLARNPRQLTLVRTVTPMQVPDEPAPRTEHLFVEAWIDAAQHPLTHPQASASALPPETLTVHDSSLLCHGESLQVDAEVGAWGSGIDLTTYVHDAVPGGWVAVEGRAQRQGQPWTFSVRATLYKCISD